MSDTEYDGEVSDAEVSNAKYDDETMVLYNTPLSTEAMKAYERMARILGMDADVFAAQSVKDRDTTLFLLMRENAVQLATLNYVVSDLVRRINEYEKKAREAMEPENLQALMGKLTGGLLGGNMLKGMF